ncbi:hypothetical protein Kisp02_72390 [Kineosporia sp. NBRC 101731]|nr:hypothetical protein Kisp02_72390 [Kineosporia sp. NBRC 101731]
MLPPGPVRREHDPHRWFHHPGRQPRADPDADPDTDTTPSGDSQDAVREVLIIGSGPSGYTAAIYSQNLPTVYESSSLPYPEG